MAPPTQAEIQAQRDLIALQKQQKDLNQEIKKISTERRIEQEKLLKAIKDGKAADEAAAQERLKNLDAERS